MKHLALAACCLSCGVVASASVVGAADAAVLERSLPGYRIARVLPAEGRLVLEHPESDRFIVLRAGDEVPGLPGTRLETIGRSGAVFVLGSPRVAESPAGVSVPERWLLLRPNDGGGYSIIEVSSRPEDGLQPEPPVDLNAIHVAPAADLVGDHADGPSVDDRNSR